jgi:hypothetical protein
MGVTLLIALAVLAYSALTENQETSEANLDAARQRARRRAVQAG